mgnify:CR=1 FL=1
MHVRRADFVISRSPFSILISACLSPFIRAEGDDPLLSGVFRQTGQKTRGAHTPREWRNGATRLYRSRAACNTLHFDIGESDSCIQFRFK